MWIRGQCRKILQEIDFLVIERVKNDLTPYLTDNEEYKDSDKYAIISYVSSYQLGIYATEDKALKVLDMIQQRLAPSLPKAEEINFEQLLDNKVAPDALYDYNSSLEIFKCEIVFQMPQDDEVII